MGADDKPVRLRARIDPVKCKAYSVCANLAPEVFLIDEWGFGYVRQGEVTPENDRRIQRAVRACPVKAIDLVDMDE